MSEGWGLDERDDFDHANGARARCVDSACESSLTAVYAGPGRLIADPGYERGSITDRLTRVSAEIDTENQGLHDAAFALLEALLNTPSGTTVIVDGWTLRRTQRDSDSYGAWQLHDGSHWCEPQREIGANSEEQDDDRNWTGPELADLIGFADRAERFVIALLQATVVALSGVKAASAKMREARAAATKGGDGNPCARPRFPK